jgi:Trm5-related predicted tRNA methylase
MKRQGKQLPLRFCAIVTLEVRASCCWLSWWGLKPGYPILNLDLSSNNGVALYDILKNGKTQEYTVSWKSHGYYVWDEKGVIVNYLPKMREWTSTVIETLRSPYACLYWVHPAIKISNVLLLHDCTTLHSSVCNRGHHKFCMGGVTTSILHSWPWTIRLSPVWSFEKRPVRAPLF